LATNVKGKAELNRATIKAKTIVTAIGNIGYPRYEKYGMSMRDDIPVWLLRYEERSLSKGKDKTKAIIEERKALRKPSPS
jgi:hypothetical protein